MPTDVVAGVKEHPILSERPSLVLTPDELRNLTGFKVAAKQLAELHRGGYLRARIGLTGRVILERDYYRAVCEGRAVDVVERPRLRPMLRAA